MFSECFFIRNPIQATVLALVCLGLSGCGWLSSMFVVEEKGAPKVASEAQPVELSVYGPMAQGGVAPADSGIFKAFYSVWVGSYLDEAPAKRAVKVLQKQGLSAFTIKKNLVEKKLPFDRPIGDYYLVLTGLFGEESDALDLGRRLKSQGLVVNWQVIPADDPGELSLARIQTEPLVNKSNEVAEKAREGAGRPLNEKSPAATGEAFKKMVYGRYVGSFKDIMEARKEANRLTSAGWPASVEQTEDSGGAWYRVYMVESEDRRSFKASPEVLEEAKASAGRQQGLVLLVDTSVKGVWGRVEPASSRRDASACAGYSQAGRLLTNLERLIAYVPDTSLLMAIRSLSYDESGNFLQKAVRPISDLWKGEDSLANTRPIYGPVIYNRPEVLASIRSLAANTKIIALGPALKKLPELEAITGRKMVLLYSDFKHPDDSQLESSLGLIRGQYGTSVDIYVIYGDTDDRGLMLAQNLARSTGSKEAWNGCLLLADNNYFEKFVRNIFKK